MAEKLKSYISGFMTRNFNSLRKIDKYFRMDLSESMSKAVEENWIRLLGIDYQIISFNLCKNNEPLGIAIQSRNSFSGDNQEMVQRHYLRVIMSQFCIGSSNIFMVGDELLEVNGLKIYGMKSKDVVAILRKLPNYMQIVVARSIHNTYEEASDYGGSEDINSPISFYDVDEDISSRTSTLKSNSSLFSSTSRDYGSTVSVGGLIDGRYDTVSDYLQTIIGWRGPIVLEFRKRGKEGLGLALEEIKDPRSSQQIIVFKIILSDMKAGQDGRLHVGDRLLHVNGRSINGIPFRRVCQWMKSSIGGRLVLYICKPHFKATDSSDYFPDNCLYHTMTESDKLPKLNEETNDEFNIVVPPVPQSYENDLYITGNGNKLGLFLDIVDLGKNGCRIKRIAKGLAKDNGILREGDYITMINGISLIVDEKYKLENCLRLISQCKSDYKITFLKIEDIDLHKLKYSKTSGMDTQIHATNNKYYPNITSALSRESSVVPMNCPSYEEAHNAKPSFEMFNITIINDKTNQLGLVLCQSQHDPRCVAIAEIVEGSLGGMSLLRINDEILSVNNTNFEFMSNYDAVFHLKKLISTETILHFKIKRLLNQNDESIDNVYSEIEIEEKYRILSKLPDMYFCIMSNSQHGFGFSVIDLEPSRGVAIRDIDFESEASKIVMMKSGHKFVVINNRLVDSSSVSDVINTVKASEHSLSLIMETIKFREFNVRVIKDSLNSLGLNVAGGIDTKSYLPMIESVVPDTMCQYSSKLQSEDIIIEVNGYSMFSLNHGEIISILRALPQESNFKILRKLPFWKREFLDNIFTTSLLEDYLQSCEFSVTIKKPVDTITSFGINFGDILILNPTESKILQRYKAVISIERNSLSEKYAPQVINYCYLVAVNNLPIDVNMSCEDLKSMVDRGSQVELLLSKDIPYNILVRDICDSNILLPNIYQRSHSDSFSYSNPIELLNTSESQYKVMDFGNSKKLNEECDAENYTTNLIESEQVTRLCETDIDTVDEEFLTKCAKTSLSLKDKCCSYDIDVITPNRIDFGIVVDVIIVPKIANIKLGFHVFGGLYSGPNGESLPICVVGVKQNTCNWPTDRKEPFISSGCQLLELNGSNLTTLECSIVEKLLNSTEGDWRFKVVKFKL